MGYFQLHLLIFLFSFVNARDNANIPALDNSRAVTDSFKLTFNRVGYGPNMYELQPAFRVRNNLFCFTNEEAWVFDKKVKPTIDTLYSGFFRATSIDSINSILLYLRKGKINVSKRYTDGATDYMEIVTQKKKYSFQMDNTSDTTAQKIIDILNSYITNENMRIRLMK